MYIVTGASSGIGNATALSLAKQNCKVLAVARSVRPLEELVKHYPAMIEYCSADLSTAAGIKKVVDKACATKLSGVVHAAGSTVPLADYRELHGQTMLDHMAIHVNAPIAINNALGNKLQNTRIIYIDSYSANAARIGWAGYSIVKAASQMAAKAAVSELTQATVIRVFPGAVLTPLVNAVLSSTKSSPTVSAFRELQERGEIADAIDIGNFVADILIHASTEQLAARELWAYDSTADRLFEK